MCKASNKINIVNAKFFFAFTILYHINYIRAIIFPDVYKKQRPYPKYGRCFCSTWNVEFIVNVIFFFHYSYTDFEKIICFITGITKCVSKCIAF